jgi:hypothetical protein
MQSMGPQAPRLADDLTTMDGFASLAMIGQLKCRTLQRKSPTTRSVIRGTDRRGSGARAATHSQGAADRRFLSEALARQRRAIRRCSGRGDGRRQQLGAGI